MNASFLWHVFAHHVDRMGEDFQAKATLQSVMDNSPVKEIVDKAQLKLMTLEKKTEEMEATELDTLEVDDIQNR